MLSGIVQMLKGDVNGLRCIRLVGHRLDWAYIFGDIVVWEGKMYGRSGNVVEHEVS